MIRKQMKEERGNHQSILLTLGFMNGFGPVIIIAVIINDFFLYSATCIFYYNVLLSSSFRIRNLQAHVHYTVCSYTVILCAFGW